MESKSPAASTSLIALLDRALLAWTAHDAAAGATSLRGLLRTALFAPAREFLDRPGKAFRGQLVARAWAIAGGVPGLIPEELPHIVELIHAGSLILDDIQDDSLTRRGAPALHRIVGTPMAINTASFLYCWPLELLGHLDLPEKITLELYRKASATLLRCHQGQAIDLTVRVFDVPRDRIPATVESSTALKSGSLMEFAAALGALGAGGRADAVAALARCGRELGVGLQMLDDLSGILSDRRRDKGIEDLLHARLTWVWALVARAADDETFDRLRRQAQDVAAGEDPAALIAALRRLVAGGRTDAHDRLFGALADLHLAVGETTHVRALAEDIHALEGSYV